MSKILISWLDNNREPTEKPDPAYPDGMDVDLRSDKTLAGCKTGLPYPARRCGVYIVACEECGYRTAITTAGRPDDPRSIVLPCKPH